jgi:hypothetical protein
MEALNARSQETFELTLKGPMPPNAVLKFSLPRSLREDQMLILACASWELDEAPRFLLQLQLREHRHFSEFARVALLSKEGAEAMLLSSFSERDFFGNQVRNLRSLLRPVEPIVVVPKRARAKVRRRGHRDPSSGVSAVLSHEYQNSYQSTEAQLRVEEVRENLDNLFQSFWGWAVPHEYGGT